jgi:hypothetical protein
MDGATAEEERQLRQLLSEIRSLQAGIERLDGEGQQRDSREVELLNAAVDQLQSATACRSKSVAAPPPTDGVDELARQVRPATDLFGAPPTERERKTCGVTYVRGHQQMVAQPLPQELITQRADNVTVASVFFDLRPGHFQGVRPGNQPFESVPFPEEGDPLLAIV